VLKNSKTTSNFLITSNKLLFLTTRILRNAGGTRWGFSTWISIVGVMLGMTVFIVVSTILSSLKFELQKIVYSTQPHISIYKVPNGIASPEDKYPQIRELLKEEIMSLSPFFYGEALLESGGNFSTVIIRWGKLSQELTKNEVLMGEGLANKLNLKPTDKIHLVSLDQFKSEEFLVKDILHIGLKSYDEKIAFVSEEGIKTLFKSNPSGIDVQLKDPLKASLLAHKLRLNLPYSVRSWQEMDAHIFDQIQRDGTSIEMIVFFITIAACLNILIMLLLMIEEKSKEINILGTMGLSNKMIYSLILFIGIFLGTLGALSGMFLGTVILTLFSHVSLGEFQKFYFVSKIPVYFQASIYLEALFLTLFFSFLGSIIPAIKLTKRSKLHGLTTF